MKNLQRVVIVSIVSVVSVTLAGCNLVQTAPIPVSGSALNGRVHGGQQPVSGSTIALYAAGATGYGSAFAYTGGTSLLGATVVTTDDGGNFNISAADYTCPSAATPVYLVATGGNPGLSSGGSNPALALMAALGPCGSLTGNTRVMINELTTVGSIWALSPFMTAVSHIGTSSTNAQGLINAFAAVNKVVNIGAGVVAGPALPAGATLPTAKINTLANALAACVNSNGATTTVVNGVTTSNTPCGRLFAATTINGVAPTDTITAAMNIAQHPNVQTAALTNMGTSSPPFQPSLSSTPNDFSIVISYAGGGISNPKGVAVDNAGNVWVPNSGNNTVTKLDAAGVTTSDPTGFLSGATGFSSGSLNVPAAIAIDQSGNAWITNAGNNTVSKLSPAGSSTAVYSGGGLSTPGNIAIDAAGSSWVANAGNASITQITSVGILANYTGAGIATPSAIAINPK